LTQIMWRSLGAHWQKGGLKNNSKY
jgi:hypothetical protein